MNDKKIIQQIRENKHGDALDTLYKTAYPKIRSYILKNNGNIESVKDIFHEAIIVLIEKVRNNTYNESLEINGFLYSVARNKWVSAIRKDQSYSKYVDHTTHQNLPTEKSGIDFMMDKELRTEMRNILSKLKDKCRKLVELYTYQNNSLDEIAVKLDYSSRNAVKTAHYKCKQKLKEFMLQSEIMKELMGS